MDRALYFCIPLFRYKEPNNVGDMIKEKSSTKDNATSRFYLPKIKLSFVKLIVSLS